MEDLRPQNIRHLTANDVKVLPKEASTVLPRLLLRLDWRWERTSVAVAILVVVCEGDVELHLAADPPLPRHRFRFYAGGVVCDSGEAVKGWKEVSVDDLVEEAEEALHPLHHQRRSSKA